MNITSSEYTTYGCTVQTQKCSFNTFLTFLTIKRLIINEVFPLSIVYLLFSCNIGVYMHIRIDGMFVILNV